MSMSDTLCHPGVKGGAGGAGGASRTLRISKMWTSPVSGSSTQALFYLMNYQRRGNFYGISAMEFPVKDMEEYIVSTKTRSTRRDTPNRRAASRMDRALTSASRWCSSSTMRHFGTLATVILAPFFPLSSSLGEHSCCKKPQAKSQKKNDLKKNVAVVGIVLRPPLVLFGRPLRADGVSVRMLRMAAAGARASRRVTAVRSSGERARPWPTLPSRPVARLAYLHLCEHTPVRKGVRGCLPQRARLAALSAAWDR